MIITDKKLKKRLDRVPDRDKNGDPIYKIAVSKPKDKDAGKSSGDKK